MHRPIDVASNQVDVRFQYSCGYTTAFSDLARCRFGDAAHSPAAYLASVSSSASLCSTFDRGYDTNDGMGYLMLGQVVEELRSKCLEAVVINP